MDNTAGIKNAITNETGVPTNLGTSPIAVAGLGFLLIAIGSFVVGWLIFISCGGPTLLIFILLCGIPVALMLLLLGLQFFKMLVTAGGLNYRRTNNAIRDSRIGITYFLRDFLGNQFIVVDESRRLLCVDGVVIGFDDVKNVGWESSGLYTNQIDVILKSGAKPIRSVNLGIEPTMKQGFQRLSNSLGFTV